MLVGGDICKALLKQEIRFRGLFPWTSLWFVVGWGFFCFVLWLGFFSWGSKEIYKVFLWGFGSISWKDDWDAKSTYGIAMAPSHSKAEAGAASAMARRKLVMEGSRSGAVWGRLCWATLTVRVPPRQACPGATVQPQPTPAPPAGSWVWYRLQEPAAWLASTGPALST